MRQAARRDRKLRFVTLLHHVYAVEQKGAAYSALKTEGCFLVWMEKHNGAMGRIWGGIFRGFLRG
ncbi:MAG: hypothetical protein QW279_13820 [Candidatus Jordarchaeaceae archaeon]